MLTTSRFIRSEGEGGLQLEILARKGITGSVSINGDVETEISADGFKLLRIVKDFRIIREIALKLAKRMNTYILPINWFLWA